MGSRAGTGWASSTRDRYCNWQFFEFSKDISVSNATELIGDVEFVATSKTSNAFYGLVDNDWGAVSSLSDVTIAPPYSWEPRSDVHGVGRRPLLHDFDEILVLGTVGLDPEDGRSRTDPHYDEADLFAHAAPTVVGD